MGALGEFEQEQQTRVPLVFHFRLLVCKHKADIFYLFYKWRHSRH